MDWGVVYQLTFFLALGLLAIVITIFVFAVSQVGRATESASRESFLDEESKSDAIDSASAAYMLFLRDAHGLSFRISETTPELGSKAAVLNSLVLQRLQFNKLATQATNRLHQFLLAVFRLCYKRSKYG